MSAIGGVQRSSLHFRHQLRCHIKATSRGQWGSLSAFRCPNVAAGTTDTIQSREARRHHDAISPPGTGQGSRPTRRLLAEFLLFLHMDQEAAAGSDPTCELHVPSQANTWGLRACPDDSHRRQVPLVVPLCSTTLWPASDPGVRRVSQLHLKSEVWGGHYAVLYSESLVRGNLSHIKNKLNNEGYKSLVQYSVCSQQSSDVSLNRAATFHIEPQIVSHFLNVTFE